MYQSIQLNLNDSQYKNLGKGKSVNVSPLSVGTGHNVFLTQRQINKIKKNVGQNKGTRISLSQPEMDYNLQHGSGFKDWVRKGWNAIKNPVKNLGKKLVNTYGDQAVNMASNMANNLLDKGTLVASAVGPQQGLLGKVVQDTIKMGNNAAQDQILAILKGLKSTVNGNGLFNFTPEAAQRIDTMTGQGFFDDVLNTVASPFKAVVNTVAPVASGVAEKALSGLLAKALSGGGRRGRPRKLGKGIFSDIMYGSDKQRQEITDQASRHLPKGAFFKTMPDGREGLVMPIAGNGIMHAGQRAGRGILPPGARMA